MCRVRGVVHYVAADIRGATDDVPYGSWGLWWNQRRLWRPWLKACLQYPPWD